MIDLLKTDLKTQYRQSSKGNQLKWQDDKFWYKADYTGYEGLAEYIISGLLRFSSLQPEEYVLYETEQMRYNTAIYQGCCSQNFLPEGWQLITLERLFLNQTGTSLNKSLYTIQSPENRLKFLVDQTIRLTGLSDFGEYMSKILTIDAFFLNEDRHTHNLAVLFSPDGQFHYCPVFDNGASLLSDTSMDYPLDQDTERLVLTVRSKTFCQDFDEQLDIAETLYGQALHFYFTQNDIQTLLDWETYYPDAIKERVKTILFAQMRKYSYLFK